MSSSVLELRGRVTRSDNHTGVHGVRVEVWAAGRDDQKPLAVVLTNRDGTYYLDLRRCGSELPCCECPDVYVRLRDRDCRLLHDGCLDRRCCKPGEPLVIDVVLPHETLWWHLSRPVSWERIDEPLLPVRVMQEIEDALEILRADGTASDVAALRVAVCAQPPIDGFDNIVRDAWAALQGDLEAAERYADVLRALCATQDRCDEPFAAEVARIFDGACQAPPCTDCAEPAPCAPCPPGRCAEPCSCCGTAIVSDDKIALLVMAALHVACADSALARRFVEVLLDQICRFETIGALHAAALNALLGDVPARAQVRDLLELLCARCQGRPESGCVARHAPRCCMPCLDERLARCLRAAVHAWCAIRCYRICEVRPPRACPGDEILLVGCGFGERPGRVVFRGHGKARPEPAGTVRSWCDDRIAVVVPQGAGCGLWLELPPITIDICGRFLELRRLGCIEHGFEGTSAEILRFDIKGVTAGACLPPGAPLRIRWNTCAADRVRVELVDTDTGAVIAAQDPAAANGRWDFTATQFTHSVHLRVQITASGRCTPPSVSRHIDVVIQRCPHLQVHGLEVTQAIQYYRAAEHLTDAADRGADNTLRLVTNKTAWVRTYLRSGQDPSFDNGQLAGVTGTLRVERRTGGVWHTIANLAPQNGPITAEDSFPSYDAERGNINTTLNFVVPANLMTGLLRFTVNVASPFAPCHGNTATGTVQADVNLTQTLNAAFITIGYNGPNASNTGNIVLPAPTLAQCQAETSWAMTTYPVSGAANVRIGGTFVTTTPLNDARSCPGCCSPNWQPLLQQVAALVALDQTANPGPWVYYGLVAGGIPVNVPGCSGWGATGGLAGAPPTYAHEMGHQFGLPHARCGNAGNGNPNYPVYEPYDLPVDPPNTANWTMASIGEYGLDINTGAIANPNDAEDFMSYCGPRWISIFTHNYLLNIAGLSPVVIATGSGAPARRITDPFPRFEPDENALRPLIHMLGVIGVDGKVDVRSVARLTTRYLRGRGRQTGYVAQHLDAHGRVLAQDSVYGYVSEGGCSGCHGPDQGGAGCEDPQPVLIKAMLDDTAPGTTLRILKRGEVVWERKGTARPPALGSVSAVVTRSGDLELTWKLECSGKADKAVEPEVWVRWTGDDGATWHALTVGQRGPSVTIDREQLPSGPVRFELLGHDGFHTVCATTDTVVLPARPPAVSILYPAAAAPVYNDRQLHLLGSASSVAGSAIAGEQATWIIDDKPVGHGLDLWVESPGPGAHSICLRVEEGELVGEARTEIQIADQG